MVLVNVLRFQGTFQGKYLWRIIPLNRQVISTETPVFGAARGMKVPCTKDIFTNA